MTTGKRSRSRKHDASPQPIRLIVMLDVSGSMEGIFRCCVTRHTTVLTAASRRPGRAGLRRGRQDQPDVHPQRRRAPGGAAHEDCADAPTPLWRALDDALDGFGGIDASRKVILVLSDGKDSGPTGFRQRPGSQAGVIDRARLDDVMIYAIGLRSRRARPATPGLGPGGLQAMLLSDLPDPGLARVAGRDRRRLASKSVMGRISVRLRQRRR